MISSLLASNILPLAEFKSRAAEVLSRLKESGQPVVLTQNGKAAAVLVQPDEYDKLAEKVRFIDAVELGLTDSEAGNLVSHDLLVAEVRQRYGRK